MWLVCFGFWGKGGWVWEVEIIRLGIEILGSGRWGTGFWD